PLASHTSGPPQRASIPVLALEAQPPTGLPSRSTCRGAGPLQVLKTRGFEGDSRPAGPVRPVYNADQPITALKGTGIHAVRLPRIIRMGRYIVTNLAYLKFVQAGGYENDEFWRSSTSARRRFVTSDQKSLGPAHWPHSRT